MTTASSSMDAAGSADTLSKSRRGRRGAGGLFGLTVLALVTVPCFLTLPWSLDRYDLHRQDISRPDQRRPPSVTEPMGTDVHGRSLVWRILLGGAISLGIGLAAALIAVVIGVGWGAISGYAGGRIDALMMRFVDVMYGLPYILLVVLVDIALQPIFHVVASMVFSPEMASGVAEVVTLLVAIGGVSWLTVARVIRGQVLSLRSLPFIEAARAYGVGPLRMLWCHLLPNLIGPIIVYTTLTVPIAILQESFLSFLGIGVQPPRPSWGNLAAEGLKELHNFGLDVTRMRWWLFLWPCLMLGLTLMALNFLGDALRTRLDPRLAGVR